MTPRERNAEQLRLNQEYLERIGWKHVSSCEETVHEHWLRTRKQR